MYLRPSTRVNSCSEYLIRCNGAKEGEPCGELIWIHTEEKSECPHCGRVYARGYFGLFDQPVRHK